MKRHLCRGAALAVTLLLAGQAAVGQTDAPGATVESLLEYARAHNPELAAMRAESRAAHERVEPAGAWPDPRLRVTLQDITRAGTQSPTLSPGRTGATTYQWMQDIPAWGKSDLRRDVARHEAMAQQARLNLSHQDLNARIKSIHAQRFLVLRSIVLARENRDLIDRLEKVALTRYAAGLAPQQDVIRAQVEQGSLASELVALETEEHHLHTRLNALLARPASAPLEAPTQLRSPPPTHRLQWDRLTQRAEELNPTLTLESARLDAALRSRDLAQKNRLPDVTVGVAPMQMGTAIRQWELMLEVTVPLQRATRDAQQREAQAMVEAAQARRQSASDQVRSEMAQALTALEASQRTEALTSQRLLPQAELTFQSALAGYETGKVDFATLLDAQRQIRSARLAQLKAATDGQMQLAEIERLLGEDL